MGPLAALVLESPDLWHAQLWERDGTIVVEEPVVDHPATVAVVELKAPVRPHLVEQDRRKGPQGVWDAARIGNVPRHDELEDRRARTHEPLVAGAAPVRLLKA